MSNICMVVISGTRYNIEPNMEHRNTALSFLKTRWSRINCHCLPCDEMLYSNESPTVLTGSYQFLKCPKSNQKFIIKMFSASVVVNTMARNAHKSSIFRISNEAPISNQPKLCHKRNRLNSQNLRRLFSGVAYRRNATNTSSLYERNVPQYVIGTAESILWGWCHHIIFPHFLRLRISYRMERRKLPTFAKKRSSASKL